MEFGERKGGERESSSDGRLEGYARVFDRQPSEVNGLGNNERAR
jgi:hypothetical protein